MFTSKTAFSRFGTQASTRSSLLTCAWRNGMASRGVWTVVKGEGDEGPTVMPVNGVKRRESKSSKQQQEEHTSGKGERLPGFTRPELGSEELLGTVPEYSRHLFVVDGTWQRWSAHLESYNGPLRDMWRLVKSAPPAVASLIKVTAVQKNEAFGDEDGDILLFPEEIRIRGVSSTNMKELLQHVLTGFHAESAKEAGIIVTPLEKKNIFVCSHYNRDWRCGLLGPYLVSELERHLKSYELEGIPVRPCSHVGGHKYAGNVLVYSRRGEDGRVVGDWYGYVTPEVAEDIVNKHLGQNEIVRTSWRGSSRKLDGQPNDSDTGCGCGPSVKNVEP